jgi:digeranylgeranylglycerophospholipid reductase
MSDPVHIDVVVAGLGPAGACAAREAARAGLSVVAIEKKAEAGTPVQCAEFVPAMVGIEVTDLSVTCRQAIDSMVTFVEGDAPDVMENFPGQMIDRQAFDRQLVDMAIAAGVDCRFGVVVKSVLPDGSLNLSNGESLQAKVIIGADGPRSRIGAAIEQTNTELVETRQISVPLLQPHSATDIFLSASIAGGYGWLFPKGDVANLGLGVEAGQKDKLKPLLENLHRELIEAGRVGEKILYHTGGAIPVGGILDPVGHLGDTAVLLAGDAAGLTNPVTGAGINAAVLSGNRAGEYANLWLQGDLEALDDYREELEDLFKPGLDRACKRRQNILQAFRRDSPTGEELRNNWIAYPEYWAA